MTRSERSRRRNAAKRYMLALFLIIVPLAAITASYFFMNIYNKGNDIKVSIEGKPSEEAVAFKYSYDIEGKSLYRIDLKGFESFGEAEAYIGDIKARKLNGFILKEDGYKVIYGAFTDYDGAEKVREIFSNKEKSTVSEFTMPGYSLQYDEYDSTFIQLLQATDQLIWKVIRAKAEAAGSIALNSKFDKTAAYEKINEDESKLQRYLGYAQKSNASSSQRNLKEHFVILLENILEYKLEQDSMDYYKIQDSLLNQTEAYRRFAEKLSI